jgi:hypothetical protein
MTSVFPLFSFLLAAVTDDTEIVQRRLDGLVNRCDAYAEIQFVAREGGEVEMKLLTDSIELTSKEKQHLNCVFNGLKSMPELSFGFIGNALPDGS